MEKFKGAREINDLFHESPLELEGDLWRSFKQWRIRAERQFLVSANRRRYCLDFALFCRRGLTNAEYSVGRFCALPAKILVKIRTAACNWCVQRLLDVAAG